MLTNDSKQRKETPITTGVLDYFPLAIAAVARVSFKGNQKHNPGQPLHWSRDKSTDHDDCIGRHLLDREALDEDGESHAVHLAWRALAAAQIAEEKRLKYAAMQQADQYRQDVVADLDAKGVRHLGGMPFSYAHQPKHVQTLMDELADSAEAEEPVEAYETTSNGWVHGRTGGDNSVKYSYPEGQGAIDPSAETKWTNTADMYTGTLDNAVLAPQCGVDLASHHDFGVLSLIAIDASLMDRVKVIDFGGKRIVAYNGEPPTAEEVQAILDMTPPEAPNVRPVPTFIVMLTDLLFQQGVSSEIAEQIIRGTTYHPFTINATGFVYIAGPMRGYAEYNFPAFDAARDRLQEAGFVVTSPADIDREADGQDVTAKPVQDAKVYAYRDFSTLLMIAYTGQGYIAMLPGWEKSTGAVAEFFLARWLGLTVLDASTLRPLEYMNVDTLQTCVLEFLNFNYFNYFKRGK